MARQPRTPGATTEAPKATETKVVTTTTADQADAALDAILGTPDSESTSTPSEPVAKRTRPVLTKDGWTSEEY